MKTTGRVAIVWAFAIGISTAHAEPTFFVSSAEHLGDGLVQYRFSANNDLGGGLFIQLIFEGNIQQVESPLKDLALMNGRQVDSDVDALFLDSADPVYSAATDSFFFLSVFSFTTLPFSGFAGGEVGETLYAYSGGSQPGVDIGLEETAQIVVFDPAAQGLPLGDVLSLVIEGPGIAQLTLGDLTPFGGRELPAPSLLAAGGQTFDLTGRTFALIPEPSTGVLAVAGLLALMGRFLKRGKHGRIVQSKDQQSCPTSFASCVNQDTDMLN